MESQPKPALAPSGDRCLVRRRGLGTPLGAGAPGGQTTAPSASLSPISARLCFSLHACATPFSRSWAPPCIGGQRRQEAPARVGFLPQGETPLASGLGGGPDQAGRVVCAFGWRLLTGRPGPCPAPVSVMRWVAHCEDTRAPGAREAASSGPEH